MRIILKPLGFFIILGCFLLLIVAVVSRNGGSQSASSKEPVATTTVATLSQLPVAESSVKAAPPQGVLLMPDITSREWLDMITPAATGDKPVAAVLTTVPASVPDHPYARHIKIISTNNKPWYIQIARPLSVSLKAGKRIRLTFWGRSKDSCPITAAVEQNAAPYAKVVYQVENLTPEWKQYTEEWTQTSSTPENWAKMDFQVGHKVGEVELTGVIIRQVDGGK